METETEKLNAAKKAITHIENGMVVGLGSGSTSSLMIMLLGELVADGLQINGVASSLKSEQLASKLGIPLLPLNQTTTIDINIDGADEFTEELQLIKGGGGALLREKILAHYSDLNIIITDSSKKSERLGGYPLPLEVIPFAEQKIIKELKDMGLASNLRMEEGKVYRTDQENSILDLDVSNWDDIEALENLLQAMPGIVETGLFLNSTDLVIMGMGNQTFEFKK
ncbi:ribose-5-phosphate isomerase RpiA [Muricauda oceani]|uniref:Ribose-5-phosphate isomerase A n=1 Tax=Flagellimonas oceani TaxID=2698672 RepID=A0A6G7J0F2_9FLAO|nr:ribose-5-phosphate isomerase RpiA [Allomuricauda oceani]MBW8243719.1 ribose-5-phosphate isomerase RpiA [Allomuricauda oceani]QII43922.1 ribose-5-phosphate isomerase RpiA [Allomuricauda oceani]